MARTAPELAAIADEYWQVYHDRLAADKVAKGLKDRESALEATLINEMREQQLTAIGGQRVRVALPTQPDYVPAVKNWEIGRAHV